MPDCLRPIVHLVLIQQWLTPDASKEDTRDPAVGRCGVIPLHEEGFILISNS